MESRSAKHHLRMAADICVFRKKDSLLHILLIKRLKDPYKDLWALPGGRLESNESLDQCAVRELLEETGLTPVRIHHFSNFSSPDRDPRERTVSATYIAFVAGDAEAVHGSDAIQAAWFPVSSIPKLAFDHEDIIDICLRRLDDFCKYHDISTIGADF
jgi:8-oxo-dGTP diphosphatase